MFSLSQRYTFVQKPRICKFQSTHAMKRSARERPSTELSHFLEGLRSRWQRIEAPRPIGIVVDQYTPYTRTRQNKVQVAWMPSTLN